MCDENFEHDLENYARFPKMTRRQLGAVSLGAGMMFALPRAADAQSVKEQDVVIKTPDGECDAYFVHPASGASAAVIVWPDILGLRPAFRQMGKRLAESGYAVLTVNPFYRKAKSPVMRKGWIKGVTKDWRLGVSGSKCVRKNGRICSISWPIL